MLLPAGCFQLGAEVEVDSQTLCLQGTRRPEVQIWGEGNGDKGQWSMPRELPKEDFPAVWMPRSQPGYPTPPLPSLEPVPR